MMDHVVASCNDFNQRLHIQVSNLSLVMVDAHICEMGRTISQANTHGLEVSIHGPGKLSHERPTSLVPLLEFYS